MSWVYFTTYLDGSRPILKAERDELFTQLGIKLSAACRAKFAINTTSQAVINNSLLLTDRISVMVIAGGSTGTAGLYATITTTLSGQFSNIAAAQASALGDEGITSADLSDIFSGHIDSFHLWNFYKRWIDYLAPVPPPNSTFMFRSQSASLTKCGFQEFSPISSPPKIYLTKSHSGSSTSYLDNNAAPGDPPNNSSLNASVSGAENYSHPGCTLSSTVAWTLTSYDASGGATPLTPISGPLDALNTSGGLNGCSPYNTSGTCGVTPVEATTTMYFDHNSTFSGGGEYGSFTATLSDEYTTLQLRNDTYSAIPAFSGSFAAGAITAVTNLSADEMSCSKRSFEYKFILPVLTGYTSYRLDWSLEFAHVDGSPTGIAPQSYVWDGVATETPIYNAGAPADPNDVISVAGLVASC
jgi:hypothetical protein